MSRLFGLAWLAAVILLLALWQARRRTPEAWVDDGWALGI